MSRPRREARWRLRSGAARLLWVMLLPSCGGASPATRYYTLAARGEQRPARGVGAALVVAPFAVDSAYDTDRIVYRLSPYRLDYYNYHRWSAHPGLMLADYLRRAYARSGLFREVVAEPSSDDAWVLGGRISALEEVDASAERWQAHVALELSLRDGRTGAAVWSAAHERREPMAERSPEGLAQAVSAALAHIAADSAPLLAEHARAAAGEAPAAGDEPAGDERAP